MSENKNRRIAAAFFIARMLLPKSTKGLYQKLPTICTKGRELFKKAGVLF